MGQSHDQDPAAAIDGIDGIDHTVWVVISKVAAVLLGGFILTYWVGAGFAKATVVFGLLDPGSAGGGSGVVQIFVFAFFAMWVSIEPSIVRTWIVWAVLTGFCVGLAVLPWPASTRNAGQSGASSTMSGPRQ